MLAIGGAAPKSGLRKNFPYNHLAEVDHNLPTGSSLQQRLVVSNLVSKTPVEHCPQDASPPRSFRVHADYEVGP